MDRPKMGQLTTTTTASKMGNSKISNSKIGDSGNVRPVFSCQLFPVRLFPVRSLWIGGLGLAAAATSVLALEASLGEAGIDAHRLHQPPYNLTGKKIAIGQVEVGRPGIFGVDKEVAQSKSLMVTGIFYQDGDPIADEQLDVHAHNVASIMIGRTKVVRGVAPDARLYASAIGQQERNGQTAQCLAAQHIARQNGGDLRAINFSFGEPLQRDPRPDAVLDGNALLTLCIDWSARVHDVLYAVAGNQGRGRIPIPTDHFNGMTVASAGQQDGVFRKVHSSNLGDVSSVLAPWIVGVEGNVGPRRAISVMAPGSEIAVLNPDDLIDRGTGTSLATPHITATIALLQEYGDRLFRQTQASQKSFSPKNPVDPTVKQSLEQSLEQPSTRPAPTWSLDSRRHEVMKAVLMNSADKLQDTGNGLRLGMTRTALTKRNQTWLESDAYREAKIPLHAQMGTGHLNAFRAFRQFQAGQWQPGIVPPIGWDYRAIARPEGQTPAPKFWDYELENPLQKDSFVAITLTWDRHVQLKDTNDNGLYDVGETFDDQGLSNLDLYLLPIPEPNQPILGKGKREKIIASSISSVDSVEHIFALIPKTGHYKIRVQLENTAHSQPQTYGLAWWTRPVN